MVLSTPSPPFPAIPTEIEAHILSFCDQATLAKCSTLSLAFLQLSSPLLYEDVVLQGLDSLYKLLCARPDPSYQSHLYPYLALTQIKHLSLVVGGKDPRAYHLDSQSEPIHLVQDRLPSSSSPLPLRSLSILLPTELPMSLGRSLDRFLSFFDPTSFHLKGHGSPHTGLAAALPTLDCYRLPWKRIKHFTLERARWSLAMSFHLHRSVEFSFDIRYDLSSFKVGWGLWSNALRGIVLDATWTNFLPETLGGRAGFIVHGMERIEVLVETEGGKTEVLDQLKTDCERKFGGAAWEKMRRNIEVVVVA